MNTPIHDFLKRYSESEFERCHMPGHKSVNDPLCNLNVADDITEIPGAIDIIKESERITAELFGARRTLFSCSGSTLAISAMLFAVVAAHGDNRQKRITAMRGAHRSFVDAAILLGFDIDWVYPDVPVGDCIFPETIAVFVTSIDYYGNMCDIAVIAETCCKFELPLLVDNAHGTHLVFADTRLHPIKCGATMSVDSAHKTLPALTGAAYLHISHGEYQEKYIKTAEEGLALFGTSSPSYLILNSLDLCNNHIAEYKKSKPPAFAAVARLKEELSKLGYTLSGDDLLRVTIDANAYGYSGADYAKELRNRKIICEMYDSQYVILLFSTITQNKNTQRVFEAMSDILKREPLVVKTTGKLLYRLEKRLSPRQAYFSPKQSVPVSDSVGGICGGIHVIIPPCAPVVIPGEVITKEAASLLKSAGIAKIDVVEIMQ